MSYEQQYRNRKERFLHDLSICAANRALFTEFFDFEERKLSRMNNLQKLDEGCYKTLYAYIVMFSNVNRWFHNRPWEKLSEEEIRQVYDDLEEGRIRNRYGKRFVDRERYYVQVFKGKPFRLAGKEEMARSVIEYSTKAVKEVRFVDEETFLKMVSVLSKPRHLMLFWLAWDIGENIGTLLQLTKRDFVRRVDRETNQAEYHVYLPRAKLKRSRQTRSEPTLYPQTVRYADMVLANVPEDDRVFPFGHRQALKVMHSVVQKTGAKCMPTGHPPTWKDLRSGMACHLFKAGWHSDDINLRLGHTISSRQLDSYVSYLAVNRQNPKHKLQLNREKELQVRLVDAQQISQATTARMRRLEEDNEFMKDSIIETKTDVGVLKSILQTLLERTHVKLPYEETKPSST